LVNGEEIFVNPDAMHGFLVVLSRVAAHKKRSGGDADER
jgi:hypothetical protein